MRLNRLPQSANVRTARLQGGGFGAILLALIALISAALVHVFFDERVTAGAGVQTETEHPYHGFVSRVLGSAEELLGAPPAGEQHHFILHDGVVNTPCGETTDARGPFYCPADRTIYLKPSFFAALEDLGASGDAAQALVVVHEYAHAIQHRAGTFRRLSAARATGPAERINEASQRLELQADCLAGVWARKVQDRYNAFEPGDLDEIFTAAAAIGDDALGVGDPADYAHGSSEQRLRWLKRGRDAGDASACDTFGAETL